MGSFATDFATTCHYNENGKHCDESRDGDPGIVQGKSFGRFVVDKETDERHCNCQLYLKKKNI